MRYHYHKLSPLTINMNQEEKIKAYRRDRKRENRRKMRVVGSSIRLLVNIIKKRASKTISPKKIR